jgi:hypothetical protein
METFELEYSNGRWLAPLELVDELYDALLRLPAKGQNDYITLSSRDSEVEICCATKQSKFVKEPYAYTEAQAQTKLLAWRDKRDLSRCESCDQGNKTKSPVADPTPAKTASNVPAAPNPSKSPFAVTEVEAVRCLRERGYIVAPPYPSASDTGSITPPPPYALHLSSSQPVWSVTREVETPAISARKRKRDDDRTITQTTSCPPTPIYRPDAATVAQIRHATSEPEIVHADGDDDGDDEEVVVVSAPQRKKRKTTRTTRNSPPQKSITLLRCTNTKKGILTSTISHEAAAELMVPVSETLDSPVEAPPTDAENDVEVFDGYERERLAADQSDQSDQTMRPSEGE